MATIAKLDVLLGLEDGAFTRGMENARKKLDKMGESFRNVGTKLTAGVTAPIAGSGVMMIKWAADLEQTMGATEQLWGENSDEIIKWSESANTSMGMTQDEALRSSNRFNAMFKQIEGGEGAVKDMSMGFTQLSADLSAMWGGSSIEASDALTAALRGNYEGLDKYNINLTEAMVNEEAMNVARAEGRDEITESDKVQARYNLIMEQSTDAQGQFARETDTTSGKLAILRARVVDAATRFGKLLLPYVNKAADAFSKLVTFVENLSDTQRKWVIVIAAAAAALGPLLIIIGLLLPGIGALVAVIGFLLSPIGLVVLAVAALVAGLTYAYFEFETFRNVVDTVVSAIKDGAIAAFEGLMRAMEPLGEYVSTLVGVFMDLKDALTAALSGDWSGAWESLKSAASGAVNAVWQYFTLLPSMILAAITIDPASLLVKGGQLVQGLWDGAISIWVSAAAWFGGLGTDAATAVGDLAVTLYQKGVDLLTGFFQGAVNRWATFIAWAATLGTLAFTAIGELIGTLVSKGSNIIQGFWDGATTKWTAVRVWFVNLPTMIFNAIGDVWSTLKAKGSQILQGFWTGVIGKWQDVSAWFSNLGTYITSAVGSMWNTLWQTGWDLMAGLASGILSGAASLVSAAVGSVADMIPDWIKGPLGINSPSRVFMAIGREIPAGLAIGINQGTDGVQRAMSGLTGAAAFGGANAQIGIAGGAGLGGQVIHNHNYFVTPEALQEMIDGGKFARNFSGESDMMEGLV